MRLIASGKRWLLFLAVWLPLVCLALSSTPLSYLIALPLLRSANPLPSDAIVLMSSGQIDANWLTPDGMQRTTGAAELYRLRFAPVIVSSGSNLDKGLDQATLQAKLLTNTGIPQDAILVDRKSSRTYESIVEVSKIMSARGWRTIVVVTSEFDVPRIQLVARRLNVQASFLAVPEFRRPRGLLYFPTGPQVLYHAIYEYAALVEYKLKGWI
jgi:uncharacterized SAM-binding protein YcdF (DUF218 family)